MSLKFIPWHPNQEMSHSQYRLHRSFLSVRRPLSLSLHFPVRVFTNDLAIYQTKVVHLRAMDDSKYQGTSDNALLPEKSPNPLFQVNDLTIRSIYELRWDEEFIYALHSPTGKVTLQLFDKDFNPDLHASDDLLTSLSVPLSGLNNNVPLDLILNVYCTLPQAYSFDVLHDVAKNDVLNHCESRPCAVACRIHASVVIEPFGSNFPSILLSEFSALSLPITVYTPHLESIVDSTDNQSYLWYRDDGLFTLVDLISTVIDLFKILTQDTRSQYGSEVAPVNTIVFGF